MPKLYAKELNQIIERLDACINASVAEDLGALDNALVNLLMEAEQLRAIVSRATYAAAIPADGEQGASAAGAARPHGPTLGVRGGAR